MKYLIALILVLGLSNVYAQEVVNHEFPAAGTYTVTLTVTDNDGQTDSISKTVTVTAPLVPPTAEFTVTCNDLTCTFDASSSTDPDGNIVSYSWDFGDN